MSTEARIQRADELTAQARTFLDSGQLVQGSQLAKEALSIAPNHDGALELLTLLHQRSNISPLLKLCRNFTESGVDQDGKAALQLLKRNDSVTDDDAISCIRLVLDAQGSSSDLLDELTATLLVKANAAREPVANVLSTKPTDTFRLFWYRGDRSFSGLITVILDNGAWNTTKQQHEAIQGAFQLALGKLIDVGQDHAERAMGAIVRILAAKPKELSSVLDQDAFEIILSCLDVHSASSIRSQATLATMKLLEVTEKPGEQMFKTFILSKVAAKHNEDLIIAFSSAAAVFPIAPALVAELFLTEGFLQGLIPALERNSQSRGHRYITPSPLMS